MRQTLHHLPASNGEGPGPWYRVTAEGPFFISVPGGSYLFVRFAPGYVTHSKKVVLSGGDQAIVHVDLQKASR